MRDVRGTDRALFVATAESEVVGCTRLGLVESDAPAPDGFYFLGLVVAPTHRRRGVPEALVDLAIRQARKRTDTLWSFFDVENAASAALHARIGFAEHARGVDSVAGGNGEDPGAGLTRHQGPCGGLFPS